MICSNSAAVIAVGIVSACAASAGRERLIESLSLYCYGRNRGDKVYRSTRNRMDTREHARVTGSALKNWAIAQIQDSIAVAMLWLIVLLILCVPLSPLWSLLSVG